MALMRFSDALPAVATSRNRSVTEAIKTPRGDSYPAAFYRVADR